LAAWPWFNRFGSVLCYFSFQERFQFALDFEDSILPAPMLHDFIFPVVLPLKVFAVLGAYLL
jgi:hypothetical protein